MLTPLILNCTATTATLSDAVAVRVTVPDRVAPGAGELRVTAGAVRSTGWPLENSNAPTSQLAPWGRGEQEKSSSTMLSDIPASMRVEDDTSLKFSAPGLTRSEALLRRTLLLAVVVPEWLSTTDLSAPPKLEVSTARLLRTTVLLTTLSTRIMSACWPLSPL